MRRPSSRKRQPASWLMFSCASPENDAMMRNAASTRSKMALSLAAGASGRAMMVARSLSARQASGEKRSRITEAAARAARASDGNAPGSSVSRQHRARRPSAVGASPDIVGHRAPGSKQRSRSREHRRAGLVRLGGAVDQGAHQPQRRFGALHVAADPEQIVGGAARQHAAGALHCDAFGRRQQRGLGDRAVRQHPGIGGAAPRCRLTARASAVSAMRTKPPGMTCQPSPTRARKSAA